MSPILLQELELYRNGDSEYFRRLIWGAVWA